MHHSCRFLQPWQDLQHRWCNYKYLQQDPRETLQNRWSIRVQTKLLEERFDVWTSRGDGRGATTRMVLEVIGARLLARWHLWWEACVMCSDEIFPSNRTSSSIKHWASINTAYLMIIFHWQTHSIFHRTHHTLRCPNETDHLMCSHPETQIHYRVYYVWSIHSI